MTNNTSFLERFFKLSERGTNVSTEMLAGFTTFMTMAYIIIVNPLTLQNAGMDFGAVFTATILSAVVSTLFMGLYANLPFALAPGMGLNAFFAFTVVLTMGYSWQMALTAVFLEGVIFLILNVIGIREAIVNCIPREIKKAISVGIGLFIAFLGLFNAGIVVKGAADALPLALGDIMHSPAAQVALIGILITGVLLALDVKGAIFIGILVSTVIAIPLGVAKMPTQLTSMPSMPYIFAFDFSEIFTPKFLTVMLTFLFVDMFDTIGTFVGVANKSGMMDKEGNMPGMRKALFADGVGTTVGAILGTSAVTTYVESAAGVAVGGRTGLTSVVVAGLFFIALFFSPLFLIIPAAATTPALVIVGLFMMSPILEMDLEDFSEAIPGFITIIMMPLTYSIAEGIVYGILSYTIIKTCIGKYKEVPVFTYIISGLFLLKIIFS